MPIDLIGRAKNAWNAFVNNKDPTEKERDFSGGFGYSYRPDRPRFSRGSERSIVNAVYNRIAMDVAAVDISHVRLDDNDRYSETIKSDMNECFSVEANIDQTGRAFIQDIVMSMFDEGCVAVIPVDTDVDPTTKAINKIYSMRTAKITAWKPKSVKVRAYDENTGQQKEIEVLKCNTLIIENPLYAVINEPNSTMQRLIRKLALLDTVDEQSSSGKLDLIIQLPYTVRSELRKQQAKERKKDIEEQLAGSKYGIAYIDSTEHITQLNRAVENNLMSQIEYLTNMVYSQLGITAEILNGTADEKTMLNYNNRTIKPILQAITEEIRRKWLTKTARSQGQSIMFFPDVFGLVPAAQLAELADKLTRNEIATSNEIRQIIGMKPSSDPNADQLRNKNLNQSVEALAAEGDIANPEELSDVEEEEVDPTEEVRGDYDSAIADLDDIDNQLNDLEKSFSHTLMDQDEDLDDFLIHGIEICEDFDDWLMHYASPYYNPEKAHEYYMAHRKLVGRKSTSGLNEEGREIAAHIKMNIDNERKQKIEANTKNTNDAIESYRSGSNSYIKRINEDRKKQISASSERMKRKISDFRNFTSGIKQNHSAHLKDQIDSLKSKLKNSKSPQDKERIREKIAKMREENALKREQLTKTFQDLSSGARNEHRSNSDQLRRETSETIAGLREQNKDVSSSLRAQNKKTNESIREEYDNKYASELENLKSSGQYDKPSKKTKGGKDGRTLYKYKNHPQS